MKQSNFKKFFNRYLLIVLAIMGLIFLLSHMQGDESSKQSGIIVSLIEYLGIDVNEKNLRVITLIVRKGAHMTEYFLLTLSCLAYYKSIKSKHLILLSAGTSFLYACSDEFHQTFIPGRAGLFSDVMVDSVGILFAVIICLLYSKFRDKISCNPSLNSV